MPPFAQRARLDRYEPLRVLGEGSYGIVYEALDRVTGEHVALKELRQINPTSLARFKLEFRALQEVHHPNLVRLDHLFEDSGTWTIAMELVPGTDLLSHVYADDAELGFHDAPLRAAFLQLADALIALHNSGLLHRDLKPSNVRVTPDGRVVMLDFGVIATLDERSQALTQETLGTVAYMAPEQTVARTLGPASDWYSFGVCLYEAMTGFQPFDAHTADALLWAKRSLVPPAPSSYAPGIPEDLNALCIELLAIEPEQRPNGARVRDVLARFGVGPTALQREPANTGHISAFEGRQPELRELGRALSDVEAGAQRVVLIEGESGIGKSAIIEQFLRARGSWSTPALVLRSRCYENELLAFKAFDGALEELARVLAGLDRETRREVLPIQAALLCKLFPALSSVEHISRAPLPGLAADPSAQRLQAFAAFRRLLAKLSETQLVVLAIEDLQWADAESFSLLRTLLEGPQPMRCLILATLRPSSELDAEVAEDVAILRKQPCVSVLGLYGLTHSDAWKVAREHARGALPETTLETIVRESSGHPLFLRVLVRFAEDHTPSAAADLTLDAALAAQLAALPEKARTLVEVTALAGTPTLAALCGRVAGLHETELGPLVTELCAQNLLRRRRAREIACFHDRIRRIVIESLAPEHARKLHAELAHALTRQPDVDAAVLARHHEAAGELELAHAAYQRAAEHASACLAFARSVILYQRALELGQKLALPLSQRVALRRARGHALACGGRSAEAAHEYLAAAQHAHGEERTRLRILAAQHLLQSAHVQEGMAATRALLDELGVPIANTLPGTLAQLAWNRVMVALMKVDLKPNPAAVDAEVRMRLDALNDLIMPVGWVDPFGATAMSMRYLRMARAHGERTHLIHALGQEAFSRAIRNEPNRNPDELLARARELMGDDPEPALELDIAFREGSVATAQWNLPRARERLEHAQRVGTQSCPDQPWLLTNVRTNLGSVLFNLGEFAVLADCTSAWLAEARDRNDRFARATLDGLGYGIFRHLMIDEPARGESELAEALSPWPLEPFSFAHFGGMLGAMFTELYRGGDRALRWLEREGPRLSRSILLKQGLTKASVVVLRANASLAAHAAASGTGDERLLAQVRKSSRQLRAQPSALSVANRLGLEIQLAALRGHEEVALELIEELRAQPSCVDNPVSNGLCDYLEGLLQGGETGRSKQAAALKFAADQGWKRPQRLFALLWPALDRLADRT